MQFRRINSLVLTIAFLFAGLVRAESYLPSSTASLRDVMMDPPGAAETKQEVDIVLREQARRKPADIARAQSEVNFQATTFADVLGPKFTPENLPLTFALIKKVEADARDYSEAAKKIWSRPRPPLQDERVKAGVDLPKTASYPSGHATRGFLFAMILGELFPEQRFALLERGWLVGWDRVEMGVHFPSDIAAGQKLGIFLADQMIEFPAFQSDFAKAKEECDRVYGK